ncbi:MAG: hypothetical protein J7L66_05490 [Anaerolineaceae bacterium]|nr:hypothetical protein [Anaerolineaceae bacterium]
MRAASSPVLAIGAITPAAPASRADLMFSVLGYERRTKGWGSPAYVRAATMPVMVSSDEGKCYMSIIIQSSERHASRRTL